MTERADLDRTFAAWLHGEAPPTPPDDLLAPVFAVTSTSRPMPTWRALLGVPPMRTQSVVLVGSPTLRMVRVAVVLLLLVAIGATAIFVGSQLLRIERPIDPAIFGACGSRTGGGIVAVVRVPSGTGVLYADGWFVRSGDWRRMTPNGIAAYLDAIEQSGLVGMCGELWVPSPRSGAQVAALQAHAPSGVVDLSWEAGYAAGALRALTPDEQASALEFLDRLLRPETWLPADAWGSGSEGPRITGATQMDEPVLSPPAPVADAMAIDPCGIVLPSTVGDALGRPMVVRGSWPTSGWPLGWFPAGVQCQFTPAPPERYWDFVDVTVRVRPTSPAEADALVARLFGATRPVVDTDARVWRNACADRRVGCSIGIAAYLEPLFVLVTMYPDTGYTDEQILALAMALPADLQHAVRTMSP